MSAAYGELVRGEGGVKGSAFHVRLWQWRKHQIGLAGSTCLLECQPHALSGGAGVEQTALTP